MPELPSTIDQVINALEALIQESEASKDRIGYFAALYHKVTVRVKESIDRGEFEDNARMERFDVVFANRYLEAVRQWKNGATPTKPWQTAFQATRKPSVLVLQQLLLGMNAHINLDLGIAAVEATQPGSIQDIQRDFNSINDILGSMTFEVLQGLNRISPLLSLFGLHGGNDSILIQFSLTNARDGAWIFAEDLSEKTPEDYQDCIAKRADTIDKLAGSLIKPRGLLKLTMWIIHLFEWRNPARIIALLHLFKKKYIHTSSLEESQADQD